MATIDLNSFSLDNPYEKIIGAIPVSEGVLLSEAALWGKDYVKKFTYSMPLLLIIQDERSVPSYVVALRHAFQFLQTKRFSSDIIITRFN